MSNSNENSFIKNLVTNPTSFSILVLSVVILVVWIDQRDSGNGQMSPMSPMTKVPDGMNTAIAPTAPSGSSGMLPPISMKGPSINNSDLPQIMNTMGGQTSDASAPGKLQAPDLGGLLGGLEAKVKADPTDVGKRLLLAQTYNELGLADKALVELRDMQKQDPDQSRVNLILASILSSSDKDSDVKESLRLLDKLSSDESAKQYLVQMYKGNAFIRTKDHDSALKHWNKALELMPEADNRRSVLEQRIADLSKKEMPASGS